MLCLARRYQYRGGQCVGSYPVSELKRRLLERRDELERRSRAANAELRRDEEPLSADFAEQVSQRENDEVLGAVGESADREVHAINLALLRLANGQYGRCARCGEPIEPARLHAVAHATTCLSCARAVEREAG